MSNKTKEKNLIEGDYNADIRVSLTQLGLGVFPSVNFNNHSVTISGITTYNNSDSLLAPFRECANVTVYFPDLITINGRISTCLLTLPEYQNSALYVFNATTISNSVGQFSEIHYGNKISTYTPSFLVNIKHYFHMTDNDTLMFDPSGKIAEGSSKYPKTFNFYTDNTALKNGLISQATTYTTVNVYHLDGSDW